ncbi:MAG: hypothetical protein HZA18_08235 [Nitrospirae bacterium]|nr:hypothetical protein [Nitrospirota bacterium]
MACSARRLTVFLIIAGLIVLIVPWEPVTLSAAEEIAPSPSSSEERVDVKKGLVAFVEIKTEEPVTVYILYPTQYTKYKATGSADGILEFKNITWLIYPIPALLEDQTVYFVPFVPKGGPKGGPKEGDVLFHTIYEDIYERIDRLMKGEEMLRAGMEMAVAGGTEVIRLTPLIPGLKVRLDFSGDTRFVIVKTIDLARYRKGVKSFEQLYEESDLKGSEKGINFSTTDFEDLYLIVRLIVRTRDPVRVKSVIHATKESAESGC